jgi:LemA protein
MQNWNLVIIVLAIIGYVVMLYNRLVALRQKRLNAFSDIDVQLKQRFDVIPNLVETVKGYAKHEEGVFKEVTEARARVGQSSGAGEDRMAAEGLLGKAMMNLFAVAEAYPDLKADTNFLRLQEELSDIENKIAAARRFFNNATSEYNTSIQQVPSNIIANMFNFKEEPFFELDEAEKELANKAPNVSF